MTFACPESLVPCAKSVFAGEYQIAELQIEKPVILDIGANVGAFAVWAGMRWPGAELYCFEPHAGNFELLQKNAPYGHLRNVAVADFDGERFLFDGNNNSGEASLFHDWTGQTTGKMVSVISAETLPPCDILKIDTEGTELRILKAYPHLSTTQAVMLEWHCLSDRYHIGSLLASAGFNCMSDAAWAVDCGVMKWSRLAHFQAALYKVRNVPTLPSKETVNA